MGNGRAVRITCSFFEKEKISQTAVITQKHRRDLKLDQGGRVESGKVRLKRPASIVIIGNLIGTSFKHLKLVM